MELDGIKTEIVDRVAEHEEGQIDPTINTDAVNKLAWYFEACGYEAHEIPDSGTVYLMYDLLKMTQGPTDGP